VEIEYRRLANSDLETFIVMRINQLIEEGAEPVLDLKPKLKEYYSKHIEEGTFISWLALADGNIVGTSGISIIDKPPYYSNPNGKIGLLSSLYTLREYRRRGIAKELLDNVVNEARDCGCGAVQVTASAMGTHLYADYGFRKSDRFMQYLL